MAHQTKLGANVKERLIKGKYSFFQISLKFYCFLNNICECGGKKESKIVIEQKKTQSQLLTPEKLDYTKMLDVSYLKKTGDLKIKSLITLIMKININRPTSEYCSRMTGGDKNFI